MRSEPTKYLLFYFTTALGSAVSSIASFISIETAFKSITLLASALSLKTFVSAIFSYKSESIIKIIGIRKSFIYSQLFGCVSLVILYFGFKETNLIFTFTGIVFCSLPGALVAILLTILIKTNSTNDSMYRLLSAKREIIGAIVLLIASLFTPVLLWAFNLYYALIFDLSSYILGLFLLFTLKFDINISIETKPAINNNEMQDIFKSPFTWTFILQTTAALALIGLIPMLASSSRLPFSSQLNTHLREFLWTSEAITALVASTLYLYTRDKINGVIIKCLLMCSSIFLLLFNKNSSIYITLLYCTLISLITSLSFMKFRDDYILTAQHHNEKIRLYSSFSVFQKNFIQFISPLAISIFYTSFKSCYGYMVFLFVQLFAVFLYILFSNLNTRSVAYIR